MGSTPHSTKRLPHRERFWCKIEWGSGIMVGMPQFVLVEELFRGRHFDQEIVVLNVRWYVTCKLSYRDLVAMMAERGIELAHTTILRWVQHYIPEFQTTDCTDAGDLASRSGCVRGILSIEARRPTELNLI